MTRPHRFSGFFGLTDIMDRDASIEEKGETMSNRKPKLVIDLVAPEGNAYALMAKAQSVLHAAGLRDQANDLVQTLRS